MSSYRSAQQAPALPLVGVALGVILGLVHGYGTHGVTGAIYFAVAFALAGFLLGALATLVLRLGPIGVFVFALICAAILFVTGGRLRI